MNDFYHIIGYNTQGEVQSVESTDDSWQAVELCLALSEEFGYAEHLDLWGRHAGDYGDRPVALGQRTY